MKTEKKCACEGGNLTRFIQPLVLSMLAAGPDHGYSLVRRIGKTELWKNNDPDTTGVYRSLREMERKGLIVSRDVAESKAAAGKKVYEITDHGRECMRNWVGTLKEYRHGINEVIFFLQRALDTSVPGAESVGEEPDCACGCRRKAE